MGPASHFLADLVTVLGVAAVTTVLFHWLKQPVVLGYVLAGLIIGPHVSIPLVADAKLIATLSELGVILLMFSIGIELDLRKIVRIGPQAGITALIEVSMMVSLGFLLGRLLGWNSTQSLFLGGVVGISSTMLVARSFEERKPDPRVGELVFAILVFEDILAILLLAILTAVVSGAGLSTEQVAATTGELAGFLFALLVGGLLVVPRGIRMVARMERSETLLVASLGVCFGMAHLAELAGYSIALGAFIAGMMIAESGQGHKVEALVHPFRDVFAAIFFVAVGMTIDPQLIAGQWPAVLAVTALVMVGKLLGVTFGAFVAGNGIHRSVQAGMSLAQIGELSFVIAGLGVASGAAPPALLPIAVAVSCLTAFATPWMIRDSDRVASFVDARLPRPLQTFVTFYGSWIEQMGRSQQRKSRWQRLRSTIILMLVDAGALAAAVIGTSLLLPRLTPRLTEYVGSRAAAALIVIGVGTAIAAIFLFGVIRCARRLAVLLASEIIPAVEGGKLDLGTAPRRVMVLTFELVAILAVGLPLAALLQPFVPAGGAVLLVVVLVLTYLAWRSLANLEGHVRAGSELIVEALVTARRAPTEAPTLDQVEAMLPGFAGLAPARLDAGSPAVGLSLAQLNLRALTGASVLAITRDDGSVAFPTAAEILRVGDVLALAGSDEAVAAATALLVGERSDLVEAAATLAAGAEAEAEAASVTETETESEAETVTAPAAASLPPATDA